MAVAVVVVLSTASRLVHLQTGACAVVVKRIVVMIVVVVMDMENHACSIIVEMADEAVPCRPSELERQDQHEDDGDEAMHWLMVAES